MTNTARFVAPILVLVAGFGVAGLFIATGPRPERRAQKPLPPRVSVLEVTKGTQRANIDALGTVVPSRSVGLHPEVAGVVREVSKQMVVGARVAKGDLLLRLDARNYRLAVDERRSQVAKAEVEVQLEEGRQRVAAKEWKLLEGSTQGEADEALALRKPQVKNARAALSAARSALARSRLDLARTELRAPFDAFIQDEKVEVGQLVQPTTSLATLIGTEAFWVQVSLPLDRLAAVSVADETGRGGAEALIRQPLPGGAPIERTGRVIRQLYDLDPKGKMSRVVVEVPAPLETEGELPLLLGSVVEVRIEGKPVDDAYAIPRSALRSSDQLWLAKDDKLAIVPVEVVWRGKREVLVRGKLDPVINLITSRLSAAVPGASLRVERSEGTK